MKEQLLFILALWWGKQNNLKVVSHTSQNSFLASQGTWMMADCVLRFSEFHRVKLMEL
jgi:hypothetical protein